MLPNAFTYAVPGPTPNPAPVIRSITARGARRNQPSNFADLGETLTLTAVVEDRETAADALAVTWQPASGRVEGQGMTVQWTAPVQAGTPTIVNVELTVTERYIPADAPTTVVENRTTAAMAIALHDSLKEVGEMATRFLVNFSQSPIPASVVMQDFLPGCYGTAAELADVQKHRREYFVTSYNVGPPGVVVDFGGVYPIRGRPGDACSTSDVRWDSNVLATGGRESVTGLDQVAAVYRQGRWWLCDSQFEGRSLTPGQSLLRLLGR